MKRIFITGCIALLSLVANAQRGGNNSTNNLLNQNFWKNQPSVEAVKAEIQKGNNPLESNQMNMDPIVLAINSNAPAETIKFLMSQPGFDVNRPSHEGRTYLHWAVNKGDKEVVAALIEKGAKGNALDAHDVTPLGFASMGGQLSIPIIELCVKAGASLKNDVNRDGANILLLAVGNDKDFTVTNYLISKGLDIKSVDKNGNNVFCYAARSGNIEVMKTLVQKGISTPESAMLLAAQGARRGPASTIEVYKYLEELKLKPTILSKNEENVLHFIVRKPNQKEIIEHFISKGVDVNKVDKEGNNVLINAAGSNKDLSTIELIVSKTKNINLANQSGETALSLAVKGNSPEVVKFLIDKGAEVKVLNKDGENLLSYLIQSYASGEGRQNPNGPKPEDFDQKLVLLQEKGLQANTPQKNGNTLFHLAILKTDIGLLKRVQALGIDINAKNNEGITALHKAAMTAKDDRILKYLLSIGAQKEVTTNFKETAFDLASENETLSKSNISINFLE